MDEPAEGSAALVNAQLLIAYNFPPRANAESIVTANMVGALAGLGWQSTVCTTRIEPDGGGADHTLLGVLPRDLAVCRCAELPLRKLLRLLRVLRLKALATLLSSFPDESVSWLPSALRLLKRLQKSHRWDVVHSRSQPPSGHLLGLYAKRLLGLPWLAHFSDPWLDSPFYTPVSPAVGSLHERWERAIIGGADRVTFTNDAALRRVMAKYPRQWSEKCHVVPHGFVRAFPSASRPAPLEAGCLNIVYLGSFYGVRQPEPIFRALHALRLDEEVRRYVRIWLVGRMPWDRFASEAQALGIESMVRLLPPVAYSSAQQMGRGADVLLTVDSLCQHPDMFSPSKLIEYLGMGKPIWGVVAPGSANAKLVEAARGCVADIGDPADVAGSLRRLVSQWKQRRLMAPDLNHPEICRHEMSRTASHLAEILKQMRRRPNEAKVKEV